MSNTKEKEHPITISEDKSAIKAPEKDTIQGSKHMEHNV